MTEKTGFSKEALDALIKDIEGVRGLTCGFGGPDGKMTCALGTFLSCSILSRADWLAFLSLDISLMDLDSTNKKRLEELGFIKLVDGFYRWSDSTRRLTKLNDLTSNTETRKQRKNRMLNLLKTERERLV